MEGPYYLAAVPNMEAPAHQLVIFHCKIRISVRAVDAEANVTHLLVAARVHANFAEPLSLIPLGLIEHAYPLKSGAIATH